MTGPFRSLRNLFRRGERIRVLEEEMRAHLEMLYEENVRHGLPPAEARRRAHLAFGSVLAAREESTGAMSWARWECWWLDAGIALRSLARRPAFALSLMAILALGLGATTAVFSLVRGVLWNRLPVGQPEELHLVAEESGRPFRVSAPTVRRLEADPELAGRVAAYSSGERVALRLAGEAAEPLQVQFVRGGYFGALQLRPALGRMLTPADDEPGRPRAVAVVTEAWWRRRLGGDPGALGRSLLINGVTVTVIGVAPEGFGGLALGTKIEMWLPAGLHAILRVQPSASISTRDTDPALADWIRDDRVSWLFVMLRLPPGRAGAEGRLEAAWRPQQETWRGTLDDPDERAAVARRQPHLVPSPQGYSRTRNEFRRVGLTLSLLVGAVVLVTLANTSTLLLLRMLARSRELGVRLALGASRWRLARAALMEGGILSLAGAIAGCGLGLALTPVLGAWLVPGAEEALPGPDGVLLATLAGLALALGLALGAAPAWLAAHLSPQTVLLQRPGGGHGPLRLGRALIVVQLALSVVLVAVAGSLALDLRRILRRDPGFARTTVVSTFFDPTAADIPPERVPAMMERLRQAAGALPQVRTVAFAAGGALSGNRWLSATYFRDATISSVDRSLQREAVDAAYFDAMGMTLLRGRAFTPDDRANSPHVAIVSQSLARAVFGDTDPLHRRLGFDVHPGTDDMEIVGVVADARTNGVREEAPQLLYTPLTQLGSQPGCLVIRVEGPAEAWLPALQRTVTAAEAGLLFTRWLTLEQRSRRWVQEDFAATRLTAGFGVLATLLAVTGVLGTLGYLVATRSREIAVRLALGAAPARVRGEIVGEALRLGLAGAGLGLALALLLPRWLDSWLMVGIATDWRALLLAVAMGLGAAAAGGLLPAHRAARVNPLALLRAE